MGVLFGWWLAAEALGVLALPLAAMLFARLPDRGWALAKPLGLLVLGWLVWFPLSVVTALPYSRGWIIGTIVAFALGNLALLRSSDVRAGLARVLSRERAYVVLVEVVFGGAFALMAWMRSFTPAVVDQEKFMDAAFLSAIWRAPHLPPPDPWLSGAPINYYYFGHFLLATLAKLLDTTPAIAFNVGIALIFALTAVAVFGVATNLLAAIRRRDEASGARLAFAPVAGLVAVLLVLVLGNFDGAQVAWHQAVSLSTGPGAPLKTPWAYFFQRDLWTTYDWWGPSRVIPNTINEFPAFSFLLADLHAHVLALPFAALAIGICLSLLLAKGDGLRVYGSRVTGPVTLLTAALAFGALYAINGWDLPTYLGLALVALAIQQWLAHDRRIDRVLLLDLFAAGSVLAALAVLLYLPFYRGFVSPSQGIGLVPGYARSPIGLELAIFALPFTIAGSYIVWQLARWLGAALATSDSERPLVPAGGTLGAILDSPRGLGALIVGLAAATLMLLTLATSGFLGWTVLWALLLVAVCTALALHRLGARLNLVARGPQVAAAERARVWLLVLFGTTAALVGVCELVFLRDVFAGAASGPLGDAFRMNTVFKLYYQAWLIAGIACGPALVLLMRAAAGYAAPLLIGRALAAPSGTIPGHDGGEAVWPASGGSRPNEAPEPAETTPRAGETLEGAVGSARQAAVAELAGATNGETPRVPAISRRAHHRLDALRSLGTGGIVLWVALLAFLVVAALVYPILASTARTASFTLPRSLDGTTFMRSDPTTMTDAGDADAIVWLNGHVQGEQVIVEAAKYDEYTHLGRVSAFTGLPTVLGWGGHELQWRINWLAQPGRGDVLGQRLDAVTQIYTNPDETAVRQLLRQYSVRLIYVGTAERQTYPNANLDRFAAFLPIVYQREGVTIYAVPEGSSR